jgi:hypothetical protein
MLRLSEVYLRMRYVVLLKEIKMIEAKVCGYIVSCEGVEDFEFFIDKRL